MVTPNNPKKETRRLLNMTVDVEFSSDANGWYAKVHLTDLTSRDPSDQFTFDLDMENEDHRKEFRNILELTNDEPTGSLLSGYQRNGKFVAFSKCDISKAFGILDDYGNRVYGSEVFLSNDQRMQELRNFMCNVNQLKEHSNKISAFEAEIARLQKEMAIYEAQVNVD